MPAVKPAVGLACLAVASCVALGHAACIATVAATTPDLSTLVQAVQAAGVLSLLDAPPTPVTVFAPTNEAFADALMATNMTAEALFANKPLLLSILQYHIVPAAALSTDLSDGQVLPTLLEGRNVTVSIAAGNVFIVTETQEAAQVVMADIKPADCPSVVHVINRVLLPDLEA
ncbi:hypothetical protein N2152v2_005136 [Parachlorella kessleri]